MPRIIRTIFLCFLGALTTGCMKESGETVLLPVLDKTVPVTVIPGEIQGAIEAWMPIHTGDTPPDIAGTYLASPLTLVYASDDYASDFFDLMWQVDSLDGWNRTTYNEWQAGVTGNAVEAHVIGEGDCFTLFTIEHVVNEEAGWSCDVSMLVSGRKTSAGIKNYAYAVVMRNKVDANGDLMEPDYFRVFTDGDGLSSNTVRP